MWPVSSDTEAGLPRCAWDRCARVAEGPGSSGNPAQRPAWCKRTHSQTTPTNDLVPTRLSSNPLHRPIIRQPAREPSLTSHPPKHSQTLMLSGPLGQQADSDAAGLEQGPRHGVTNQLTGGAAGAVRLCGSTDHTRHSDRTCTAPEPKLCGSIKGGPRFNSFPPGQHLPGPGFAGRREIY